MTRPRRRWVRRVLRGALWGGAVVAVTVAGVPTYTQGQLFPWAENLRSDDGRG